MCFQDSSETCTRPSTPPRSTKAPKLTIEETTPLRIWPSCSWVRKLCRTSDWVCSSQARRDSTTLLRFLSSSMILASSSMPDVGLKIADPAHLDQRRGQEAAQADVDDQAALDDLDHLAGDDAVLFLDLLDRAPGALVLSPLLGQDQPALLVLFLLDQGLDLIADADHIEGVDVVLDGELFGGDDPFGLVTDVEQDLVPVDLDDGAGDDVTVVEVLDGRVDGRRERLRANRSRRSRPGVVPRGRTSCSRAPDMDYRLWCAAARSVQRKFQQLGDNLTDHNPTRTSVTYSVRSRAGHSDMSGYRCALKQGQTPAAGALPAHPGTGRSRCRTSITVASYWPRRSDEASLTRFLAGLAAGPVDGNCRTGSDSPLVLAKATDLRTACDHAARASGRQRSRCGARLLHPDTCRMLPSSAPNRPQRSTRFDPTGWEILRHPRTRTGRRACWTGRGASRRSSTTSPDWSSDDLTASLE